MTVQTPRLRPLRRAATMLLAALLMTGCASYIRLDPPPAAETEDIPVLGLPNARFWLDASPEPLLREGQLMAARELAAAQGRPLGPQNFLALSGGGDNGAFGAGMMLGWTAAGTRPQFNMVTGISAGALIAPFAFLGPDYDPALRDVFTGQRPQDILLLPRQAVAAFSLLFGEAIADTSPLSRLIARHANEQMLAAIAAEYAKGRLLLIGTTNLDVQRPVVWNIGAIAASGHPEALGLVRRILLASASIPGAFPPVLVEVQHQGRVFQEMHVDGGATMQVFLYPPTLNLRGEQRGQWALRQRTAHVIRNGRVDVEATRTPRGVLSITRRSAATLLHYSGLGDISRIHLTTQRDGIGFRVAYIGREFDHPRGQPFDPGYMQALFDYGFERGRLGDGWRSEPSTVGVLAAP
ncbi:patatin-like phospholipase family protein [Roseococcus sp. SDR]|uniref:patatin-like phospholipase family protein n=1 Tax=Roseococcus sp. SDR TaxID=2835532 RepID=UPI001BCC934D|nr:patatin-like phospholipase family protein [Roseococcus sp. SDR]MBS7793082.1 patatin-like phospholipase family protein [Roseococcus sp. SDR]MBV1848396.1 patatin-like phospholipase family protein [Roseococcus sp. SDR]